MEGILAIVIAGRFLLETSASPAPFVQAIEINFGEPVHHRLVTLLDLREDDAQTVPERLDNEIQKPQLCFGLHQWQVKILHKRRGGEFLSAFKS